MLDARRTRKFWFVAVILPIVGFWGKVSVALALEVPPGLPVSVAHQQVGVREAILTSPLGGIDVVDCGIFLGDNEWKLVNS